MSLDAGAEDFRDVKYIGTDGLSSRDAEAYLVGIENLSDYETKYLPLACPVHRPRTRYKHLFSLQFRNYREIDTKHMYSFGFMCTIDEVLSCEIRINDVVVGEMGKCADATADLSRRPGFLSVTHQFTFDPDLMPRGWLKSFSLNLSCGPLPPDITSDIEKKLQVAQSKRLENFDYGIITRKGISSIEFVDFQFWEHGYNVCKKGDYLYNIAWKAICEKNEGKEMTWSELNDRWTKKVEEDAKKRFWLCEKGSRYCHSHQAGNALRSCCCWNCFERSWHSVETTKQSLERGSKETYDLCIAGLNICHNGIVQCPDCLEANFPRNRPQWKCRKCRTCFPTFNKCEKHESHCCFRTC